MHVFAELQCTYIDDSAEGVLKRVYLLCSTAKDVDDSRGNTY